MALPPRRLAPNLDPVAAKPQNSVTTSGGVAQNGGLRFNPLRYSDEDLESVTDEELAEINIRQANTKQFFSIPGGSAITPSGVNIAPNVLGLRDKGALMAGNQLIDIQSNREQTLGDPDTFVERRTAGLRENIAQGGKDLSERLQKTGVAGEFGRQTQQNFEVSGQQRLQQGELLALDEFTALSNNLDSVEGGMLRLMENIDFSAFSQDLQAKGMAQDLANQLTRIELGELGLDQAEDARKKAEVGTWLSIFSEFFS